MAAGADPGGAVHKLMSFTRAEFEIGLARLTGAPARLDPSGSYDVSAAAGGHPVLCLFEPEADAVLGGLLRLSRARVTLHLGAMPAAERAAFLDRFDRTFQRGGG